MRLDDSFARENVANFPDADHREASFANRIQNRARRSHRKIVPPRRAPETSRRAIEWPRDDTPDSISIGMLPRDLANLVKFSDRQHVLMRGDLQNRIGRCVKNGMAGPHMFCAQLLQDGRATTRVVSDKCYACFALDLADKLIRELFEDGKWFIDNRTGDFPMSGRGIFSGRAFLHFAEARQIRLSILPFPPR